MSALKSSVPSPNRKQMKSVRNMLSNACSRTFSVTSKRALLKPRCTSSYSSYLRGHTWYPFGGDLSIKFRRP
eukprot:483908-Prorocentrum_minimum.AAC.1